MIIGDIMMEGEGMEWRNWWEAILELVFPGGNLCPFCGQNEIKGQDGVICTTCLKGVLSLKDTIPTCPRCGHFYAANDCTNCLEWDNSLRKVLGVVPYEGVYRELIHNLKYSGRQELSKPLGYLLAETVKKSGLLGKVHLIIPVPLHPSRHKERGYNQSEWLAREAARVLHLPLDGQSMIREHFTKPQTGLGRQERLKNMEGAFRLRDNSKVLGRNILLVDDIMTTGSTLLACAHTLAEGGAGKIYGVVWAAGGGRNLGNNCRKEDIFWRIKT
jgi:ComF family protein